MAKTELRIKDILIDGDAAAKIKRIIKMAQTEFIIKEMSINGDTAVRIMKCLKENEPDIWEALRAELKNGCEVGKKSDESQKSEEKDPVLNSIIVRLEGLQKWASLTDDSGPLVSKTKWQKDNYGSWIHCPDLQEIIEDVKRYNSYNSHMFHNPIDPLNQ